MKPFSVTSVPSVPRLEAHQAIAALVDLREVEAAATPFRSSSVLHGVFVRCATSAADSLRNRPTTLCSCCGVARSG